jgi:predicted ATP-binding protein involved in virulence
LKSSIAAIIQKSFRVSQDLDSSFPKRLLNETVKITEKEFNSRFEILRQKQAKLKEFGLSESEQEIPTYDETNAKVLLVYLSDTEKKVGVFDELIQHLELFTNILNQRRFTFKTIQINKEKGFHFVTNKGKELSLTDLSSGEQHEVVLLYELIFKTTPNTVVLIDEPEISLHVTWQKEFLRDLLAIIQLQQLQVIVATHSPSIIHDRWDLVFNLQTQEMQ